MNDWKQVKLAEVADIKLSNVDKKTKLNQRAIKLCNYTDVYKQSFINSEKSEDFMISTCSDLEYAKFRLKKDQVAITKDSEKRDDIGISTYIAEDFEDVVLGYHLSLITPNAEKLSGKFLNYWFNSKQAKQYFENNAGGSGQRCTLPIDIIKSIPLQIPSLKIQEEIAEVLFSLDKKMELNNKINFELEQMAKTLYDYWFVQFDFPFDFAQGKPNEEGKPYKSSGGEMVYDEVLKREIPRGWEVYNIMKVANLLGGGTPKTNDPTFWNGGIPFFTPADSESAIYVMNTKETLTQDGLNSCSTRLYSKGTIFITARGTVGKVNIASQDMGMNQSCYALQGKDEVNSSFLYFHTLQLVNYVKSKASGSIFNALVTNDFKFTPMVIPPLILIQKFGEKTESQFAKILNNKKQNQELASLRDWLLPMLMNGQVRVGESDGEVLGLVAEQKGEYIKSN